MVAASDRERATANFKHVLEGRDLGLTEYLALRKWQEKQRGAG